MDLGTLLSVAQTVFAALQCSELRELRSLLSYKSKLDKLESTVSTILAVFRDAEVKQDLNHEAQLWLQELKDAVYDADDLLDEFLTLAQQKQLMEGGRVSKEVRLFFSRLNPLFVAVGMSQEVKNIEKKLEAIANKHTLYGSSINYQPIRRSREETSSHVTAEKLIGREADTENIIGLLLNSDVQQDVSFLTIVGMGGLGKTTLAQLVYNHGRIIKEFDLRLWACVSDHDQKQMDVKSILCKVLESATGKKHDNSTMDRVHGEFRGEVVGRKYLIVLDDVWNESSYEWSKLVECLRGSGKKGSWIVVTTRSSETARVIGNGLTYELQGLAEEDSWRLFEREAFQEGGEQANPSDLVEIGREIVKTCANNPLALRVIGSLLNGQSKNEWVSFQKVGLAKFKREENNIMPVLKFSYHHLESPLKSCFSYCALFPKDFVLYKDLLISLWMAQGYIVPLYEGQSIEDASEQYFAILLQRCFFQDVLTNRYNEIVSCKIHDLMHDIAQEVADKEICVANSITRGLDKKLRHLSVAECIPTEISFSKTKIRTYLQVGGGYQFHVDTFLSYCTCLRVLDLNFLDIKSLPSSIEKLVHLRYLDLSSNHGLASLPNSITKLYNLQTLKLKYCRGFKELPKGLSKLAKLRVLDIEDCNRLTHMPTGMGKLSCLQKLTRFAVELDVANSSSKQRVVDQLEELKTLTNLKGDLTIRIHNPKDATYVKEENGTGGGCLSSKEHLRRVKLEWGWEDSKRRFDDEEALLEDLQPHPNLKELSLYGYRGVRMPSWAREDSLAIFLPELVKIKLERLHFLECLPFLETLSKLEDLELQDLRNLKRVRSSSSTSSSSASGTAATEEESVFFPCLKWLSLNNLPELDGSSIEVDIPWRSLHKNLQFLILCDLPKLKMLPTGMQYLTSLQSLHIIECCDLEGIPEWIACLSSLRTLYIDGCIRLKSLPISMRELTSLRELSIIGCAMVLEERCSRWGGGGVYWPNIQHIPKIVVDCCPCW